MKKLTNLALITSLAISLTFSAGCAVRGTLVQPKIVIPARPVAMTCEAYPGLSGQVVQMPSLDPSGAPSMGVVIDLPTAVEFKKWIIGHEECQKTNAVKLNGYVKQLENLLKAVADAKTGG